MGIGCATLNVNEFSSDIKIFRKTTFKFETNLLRSLICNSNDSLLIFDKNVMAFLHKFLCEKNLCIFQINLKTKKFRTLLN
jgi:hypothetical protein